VVETTNNSRRDVNRRDDIQIIDASNSGDHNHGWDPRTPSCSNNTPTADLGYSRAAT
jgi:hypothetical protein